jgi:hypothetical protein
MLAVLGMLPDCRVKCNTHAAHAPFTFGLNFALSLPPRWRRLRIQISILSAQREKATTTITLLNNYFPSSTLSPCSRHSTVPSSAMRLRLGDDAFGSGRDRSDRFTAASLEDETDDPLATTLRTPRSGYVPSPLFYQELFESTYIGDGSCPVQNFLRQMNFWKVLMEENGIELEDAYLINIILRELPQECTEFRSYLEPLLENAVNNRGTISFDELDEHIKPSEPQLPKKEAKTEIDRKAPEVPRALPSSRAFDAEYIEVRLKYIRLEFCLCVKDYLGRAYFWRRMLKEYGKDISDSEFLGIMIRGLSDEYLQIGAHYNMLRTTPAFEKETLDEFASHLRVLERDITRHLRALEQDIARFESSPSLNSMRFFLDELRHRRDPANMMQLGWKSGPISVSCWCPSSWTPWMSNSELTPVSRSMSP